MRLAPNGAVADGARDGDRDSPAGARELTVGWIVSAAGATADIGATADPLLRDMFARGVARPDRMRLGLDATACGCARRRFRHGQRHLVHTGPAAARPVVRDHVHS